MLTIREADFILDGPDIREVRLTVFVTEQRVPETLELDDRDRHCVHVLAVLDGRVVGTARIDLASGGKIGRVAVLAAHRGRGVGTELMRVLHRIAARRGLRSVWCHAQTSAAPFYRRLGYAATGPNFEEAGIEHVRMVRSF